MEVLLTEFAGEELLTWIVLGILVVGLISFAWAKFVSKSIRVTTKRPRRGDRKIDGPEIKTITELMLEEQMKAELKGRKIKNIGGRNW